MTLEKILEQLKIGEDQDVEFKSAEGGLPASIWETISSFGNTEGGYIFLGVSQKGDQFEITGLRKPEFQIKAFWDGHNNPKKLSPPICSHSDITTISHDNRKVVVIRVPRASRQQRPVFINSNPLTGTFKRNFEGDYRCTEAEVRQMLRDASDTPQDTTILAGFDITDLDAESLSAFRNRFASRDPGHPFLALNDFDFLERLGGLRKDRNTGEEGLTLAGLLMFGREQSLLDALPHFHLDYQEQLSDDPEVRWTHRFTIDGKWEPNLFNFYHRTYPRLVADLDVPFKLDKESVRLGETHVHEALREALINCLIHADHQSTRPIIVLKRRDVFAFQNPGRLRIPKDMLYEGGISDPRNPNIQKMFQMLGLGEKAGSGFQKILRAWREQHWLIPLVSEKPDLEMTLVTLPLVSLIPDAVEHELKEVVGESYASLTELDRIILILAHRFGVVCNSDIQPYRREHPREIGERLKYLVDHQWLQQAGKGRGTRYNFPSAASADLFVDLQEPPSSGHYVDSSGHYADSSGHYADSSGHSLKDRDHKDEEADRFEIIAAPVREKKRAPKELVEQTIEALCSEDWLSLRTLAKLLNRDSEALRKHYIGRMVRGGILVARFPGFPNHPEQTYKTKKSA